MTIIVFDGTQLAADSRVTATRGITMDHMCKIHPLDKYAIPYNKNPRGEILNAIAYSGATYDIDDFHNSMLSYLTEDGKYYGSIKTFDGWITMKASFGDVLPRSSALIITTDQEGVCRIRKTHGRRMPQLVNDLPAIIGSGASAVGKALATVPKLTAMDLVALGISADEGCGGRMSIYKAATGKLTFKDGLSEHRKKQVAKLVSTHLLNTI